MAHAAAAQYAHISPIEHVYPLIRTQKQLDRVLAEIEEAPGIVLYTLLDEELIGRLEKKCDELSLPCRSILGPVLRVFQSYLGATTTPRVGAQRRLGHVVRASGRHYKDRRLGRHHQPEIPQVAHFAFDRGKHLPARLVAVPVRLLLIVRDEALVHRLQQRQQTLQTVGEGALRQVEAVRPYLSR